MSLSACLHVVAVWPLSKQANGRSGTRFPAETRNICLFVCVCIYNIYMCICQEREFREGASLNFVMIFTFNFNNNNNSI